MAYAASTRGTVFYAITCDAWKRLAPANVRFYRTADDARSAGLRPSTQPGCAASADRAGASASGGSVAAAGEAAAIGATGEAAAASSAGATASAAEPAVRAAGVCVVERIIDGDTLVCNGGDRVRLLLIDAPEMRQGPFGEEAKRALEAIAPAGTSVTVELDIRPRDRYGRTLAYLWLDDGRMVNEELLRAGVAVVSVYPPNVRHVDRLRAAADTARMGEVGLWATQAFVCEPGEWRAGRC